ncbi:hypothetical protein WJX72_011366 [[Myrmecia] bisecta]|uniref:Uncharacterized protein n=1 Tax=[Myrmecia] bisecta TaxID=41462 RepID=A0AAW1QGE7_9CHLO
MAYFGDLRTRASCRKSVAAVCSKALEDVRAKVCCQRLRSGRVFEPGEQTRLNPRVSLRMDGLEEVKSELRRVTAELTPLQTARNAEALKRDADQAYINRLTAAAAPLEAQVLSLTERAKQLEGRAGFDTSLTDGVCERLERHQQGRLKLVVPGLPGVAARFEPSIRC